MRNKCIHSVASITVLILNLIGFNAFSQVGIGTLNPNENALLELDATARPGGLLLPRLALTATNSPAPLVDPVPAGMTVYNTATMGTAPNEVTPGLYYHNGTNWVRMDAANGDGPDDKWKLTGNAGTTPGTHFIGTTDNVSFQVKTNNAARFDFTNNGRLRSYNDGSALEPTYSWNGAAGQTMGMFRPGANLLAFSTASNERMRILANGQIVINSPTPTSNTRLTVLETGSNRAIFGNSVTGEGLRGEAISGDGVAGLVNGGGDGVYGQNTGGGNGVHGFSNNSVGFGIRAINLNNNGIGLMVTGGNVGGLTLAGLGASVSGRPIGTISFGRHDSGTGLVGVGNGSTTVYRLNTGSGLSGSGDTGVYGFSTTGWDGTGVIGVGNGGPVNTYLYGSGVAGSGEIVGVYGESTSTSDGFGGAFVNTYSTHYTYVGGWFGPTHYKIMGNGTLSTIVQDINEQPIIMFAPEAPEVLFQDYGIGNLINGTAVIQIDPNFSKNIRVDVNHPLKVFVQLEGDCNGVFVTEKSAAGFTVKELQNGNSNVSFSWQIIATRADEKFTSPDGAIRISDNSVRFPPGPEKRTPVKREKISIVASEVQKSEVQLKDFATEGNVDPKIIQP